MAKKKALPPELKKISFRIDLDTLTKLNSLIANMDGPNLRGKRSVLLRSLIDDAWGAK